MNELRLNAQHDLLDAELALGRHAEVVPEIASRAAEHPFDEPLRCKLALALYRTGRQAAALDACRQARRALVDGLGLEPTDELRTLEQRILRHAALARSSRDIRARTAPARKTVTVLSAELAGGRTRPTSSTPNDSTPLLDRFADVIRAAAAPHGGATEPRRKRSGDRRLRPRGDSRR